MSEKEFTNEDIGNMLYNLNNKISGGHFDDKPSSGTKIELAEVRNENKLLQKDIDTVKKDTAEIKKDLKEFLKIADSKFASKTEFDSLKTKLWSFNAFMLMSLLGAILKLVIK